MRKNLLRRLQAFFSPSPAPHRRRKPHKPRVESLEDRVTPTATLYVDFGDRFPSSGLTGTIGDLINRSFDGNPPVNGPPLDLVGFNLSDTFRLRNFSQSHKGSASADALARAGIMELLRRYYEPLDITVVELTATYQNVNGHLVRGAANLDDISITLGVNEGDSKNNDTYVLMGAMTIGPSAINPKLIGLLGISNGTDLEGFSGGNGSNQTDGTVLCFMDGSGDYYESILQLAYTAAHEAGHSFGLTHGLTDFFPPFTTPPGMDPQLPYFDLMSYYDLNGYKGFSRYPQVEGNGNTDPNELNSSLGQDTIYDQMAFDTEIGANPNMEYVTGTGANNIITISKTSATQATVSVQAFSNPNFTGPITVPKLGGTTYSYTIDLTKPDLLIYAGPQNDRIILDADLGVNVRLYGLGGTDELIINGKNADSVIYDPSTFNARGYDNQPDRRGKFTIQAGGARTTIDFREFENGSPITVRNVRALTFRSPGGKDDLTVANGPGGTSIISGTVLGGGTAGSFLPLRFQSVTDLIFELGGNETSADGDTVLVRDSLATNVSRSLIVRGGLGNDTLRLQAGLSGASLTGTVTFDGGDGDDVLDITAATLTLPGGGLVFLGGAGNDSLITAVSTITTPVGATGPGLTFEGGDGNDQLTFTASSLSLPAGGFVFNGGEGNDILTLGSVSLPPTATGFGFIFRGQGGNDELRLPATDLTLPAGGFLFDGGAGNDRLETALSKLSLPDSTSPGFTYLGGDGDDVLVMSASSVELPATGILFDGGAGNDRMTAAFNSATLPDLPDGSKGPIFTFIGGEGNDTLALTGTTLALPVNGFVYDAGAGNDRLELASPTPFANLPPGLLTPGNLFDGGPGDDVLALTAANLILPSAGFTFSGDDGNDVLEISATVITAGGGGPGPTFRFFGGGGNDQLILKGTQLSVSGQGFLFNGGEGDDRLEAAFRTVVVSGNGTAFVFDAGPGNDVLALTATGVLTLPAGAFTYLAGDGDDRLEMACTELRGVGPGALVFHGEAGNDSMVLTAANLTLPANGFTFDGGDGDDSLRVAFANLAGGAANTVGFTFLGGAGNDTLTATGSANRTWAITGFNEGTMNNRTRFVDVENLISGSGNDLFTFAPGGRVSGDLDAGAGIDQINLANFPNVAVALNAVNAINGGFDATYAGHLIRSIDHVDFGPSPRDVLIGTPGGGSWSIAGIRGAYVAAGAVLSFRGFNTLIGGAGPDTMTMTLAIGNPIPPTGLVFDGGAGFDSVNIIGSAFADSFAVGPTYVVVNGRVLYFTRGEALILNGGGGNDVFSANSPSMTFTSLVMRGGAGSDLFSVTPSLTTAIQVHGDSPATLPGGDTLILNRVGVSFAGDRPSRRASAGIFTFVGRQGIYFTGIENYDAGSLLFLQD